MCDVCKIREGTDQLRKEDYAAKWQSGLEKNGKKEEKKLAKKEKKKENVRCVHDKGRNRYVKPLSSLQQQQIS